MKIWTTDICLFNGIFNLFKPKKKIARKKGPCLDCKHIIINDQAIDQHYSALCGRFYKASEVTGKEINFTCNECRIYGDLCCHGDYFEGVIK